MASRPYAFQIYFDFSAYSDLAIGLGLMLGFVFPKNFDSPYRSASVTEFWRRWHISLSSWLRDYLYVPLGGSRRGPRRTFVNLLLVMLLGGLWHGAAWTFVIWGGLHGTLLALERARGKRALYAGLPRPVRVGATFVLVSIGWVFFRAADLGEAMHYLQTMLGLGVVEPSRAVLAGVLYQPYPGRLGRRGSARHLGVPPDVELDAAVDGAASRVDRRGARRRPRRAVDPGLQPVHLLHLLTTSTTYP